MGVRLRVIFLDFDGVINDYLSFNEINDYNVEVLKRIINATDAKVVVTSSHKYFWQINNNIKGFLNSNYVKGLKKKGVDIYDCTPFLESGIKDNKREREISEYLKNHTEITQYVILDDDYIMENLKEHEIFIDIQGGLREKHIVPAINILYGNLKFYHDCTEEQLRETPEERLIRMNEIMNKIMNNITNNRKRPCDEESER